MVTADPQSPATKADIALLMEKIGDLYRATERWKEEMMSTTERWKEELRAEMQTWKEELKSHFDFIAENIRHDFRGAHRDDTENIKTRIRRLEEHTGLARSG